MNPDPPMFMDDGKCHCGKPLMFSQTMCWECQDKEDAKKPKMIHPCDGCIHLGHESLTDMGRYRSISFPVCKLTRSGSKTTHGNTIASYEMTIASCPQYTTREVPND